MLTQERLRELIYYCPYSGGFWWLKTTNNRTKIGRDAGLFSRGYRYISIDGRRYCAHRLAWLYLFGEWPRGNIDHINNNPSDNRRANLRDVSQHQNLMNMSISSHNTSGIKGVGWHKHRKKWRAYISHNNKQISPGLYSDKEDARRAVELKREELHGEFANHG